jgi:hypothetical protein
MRTHNLEGQVAATGTGSSSYSGQRAPPPLPAIPGSSYQGLGQMGAYPRSTFASSGSQPSLGVQHAATSNFPMYSSASWETEAKGDGRKSW